MSLSGKSPTDTDQNPVPVASPLSDTSPSDKSPTATGPAVASPLSDRAAIVDVLPRFGFKLTPGADPVDEQTHRLRIDSLRRLAACFGTPTPDQNKDKFLLVEFVWNALLGSGMAVNRASTIFLPSGPLRTQLPELPGLPGPTRTRLPRCQGSRGYAHRLAQTIEVPQRQLKAIQGSIGFVPKSAPAPVQTLGGEQ